MQPSPEPRRAPGTKKIRSRVPLACNACRARRTRCDSQKPACGYCRSHGHDCQYEVSLATGPLRVEAELGAINRRLDHITSLLAQVPQPALVPAPPPAPVSRPPAQCFPDESPAGSLLTDQDKSPFQLVGSQSIMTVLGLPPSFAHDVLSVEKHAPPATACTSTARLRIVQQQDAQTALAAFSTHVHAWYPFLRPGYSETFAATICGPLLPGPESCLVLLVAAIGLTVMQDHALGQPGSENNASDLCLADALNSLPLVFAASDITSVHCLLLLSIYHCCVSKPIQAYNYVGIASLKAQNLVKSTDEDDEEAYEQVKRAYWTVLLLESELTVQFDLAESGVWTCDDYMTLPDSRRPWRFALDVGSPQVALGPRLTPASTTAALSPEENNSRVDKVLSYFMAEISMRRMLRRCNTAIRKTHRGDIVYVPSIALELASQLDEWHGYLPHAIRFDRQQDLDVSSPALVDLAAEPLTTFLRVQYYCCRMSVYWPAIYQCVQDGQIASWDVREHCERFFDAYIQLVPSILVSIRTCIVNRWTLYASIFMTSMAVLRGFVTSSLRAGCSTDWARLLRCLESASTVDRRIVEASPSLVMLADAFSRQLDESYSVIEDI